MTESTQVTKKVLKNIKWSAFIEIAARIISPVLLIILARLLTPENFGLVSTATIAITFFQIFWDAGLSKALIQNQGSINEAANVVFWANLCLSIVVYCLLFLLAPSIANFFNSAESELVIKILGIQLILGSMGSVQQNLLQREINYKPLFLAKLLTAIVPVFISIPLALLGFEVWALVIGNLTGYLLGVIFLWVQSSWRPSSKIKYSLLPGLLRFGVWVMFEGILGWFISMGDNLWVGHFLGRETLGIYQVGWSITTILFSIALTPLMSILFPAFSRLTKDDTERTALYWKSVRIITSLCLPMGVGLFFIGGLLEQVLVSNAWSGLGGVISWIGLMMGVSWIVGVNTELFRAVGRPDVNTKIVFICFLYYAPVYYFASQLGLTNFIVFRFLVALFSLPIHFFMMDKVLKIPFSTFIKAIKPILIAVILMALSLYGLTWILRRELFESALVNLVTMIFVGLITYFGSLYIFGRDFIVDFVRIIKEVTH